MFIGIGSVCTVRVIAMIALLHGMSIHKYYPLWPAYFALPMLIDVIGAPQWKPLKLLWPSMSNNHARPEDHSVL
jgi:hypothetical protein